MKDLRKLMTANIYLITTLNKIMKIDELTTDGTLNNTLTPVALG